MSTHQTDSETAKLNYAIVLAEASNPDFRRSLLGGYNKRDVHRFVEQTKAHLESLVAEVNALKDEVKRCVQLEAVLRDALLDSQSVVSEARREAVATLEESLVQKEQMLVDAKRRPDALTVEIDALKRQCDRLSTELGTILNRHSRLIDNLHSNGHDLIDEAPSSEPSEVPSAEAATPESTGEQSTETVETTPEAQLEEEEVIAEVAPVKLAQDSPAEDSEFAMSDTESASESPPADEDKPWLR